jgi:hypothetical protein
MRSLSAIRWIAPMLALSIGGVGAGRAQTKASSKEIEFFESRIRPVLVEHCYKCHSDEAAKAKKLRGGLRLDTRDGLLKGGDSGPAIVPGRRDAGTLLDSLRSAGDTKMPPSGKLPDTVIADFEKWIASGAADPRGGTDVAKSKSNDAGGSRHWSYQPPRRHDLPKLLRGDWAKDRIDHFILSRLEGAKIPPAADAEPGTLIRLLTFDLIGLPPTPEEIAEFEKSAAVDLDAAMERTVDRLLQSPRFGERWARHWLDIVRYGESLTLRGFVLPEAWRYRDYVIESFNADVPLDRFVREQIAGDLLDAATSADKRRGIIAATFLALGNNNLEEQDNNQLRMDAIDEQIDTIGRAFLGQSIGCARCHDHKFDPIPTRDYYAVAGIFQNVQLFDKGTGGVGKWIETPLPSLSGNEDDLRKHEADLAELNRQIDELKSRIAKNDPNAGKRNNVIDISSLPGVVVDDAQAMKVGAWVHSTVVKPYVGGGYLHDDNKSRGEKTLTFEATLPKSGKYEVRLAYTPGENRATQTPVTVFSEEGEKTIAVNERLTPPIDGLFVSLGQYRFEKSGQCYVMVSNAGVDGYVIADAVVFIPVEKLSETAKSERPITKAVDRDAESLRSLESRLKQMQAAGPRREKALGFREVKTMSDARVHIRGSVKNLGELVPRGVLKAVAVGPVPTIPTNESGRRQLAQWIASGDNPLTARVLANRFWTWMFGQGIVRTVDNFGTTGDAPTHPELLDDLAHRLVDGGWSAKKLIRTMALSRTYRQAAANPAAIADPDNRLWSHMNRRRLDAECIRDAMLAVSGQLKLDTPGPAAKVETDYNYILPSLARSVYLPVFRNSIPEFLAAFDFADPSVSTGQRNVSSVATQALFLMNSPFVIEQSRKGAVRLLEAQGLDDAGRIDLAYRRALGRPPTVAERRIAEDFVREAGDNRAAREAAWARFTQALFASVEFRFVH